MFYLYVLVYQIVSLKLIPKSFAMQNMDLVERYKNCNEAKDKADCIARGCLFDCETMKCLTKEHSCRTGAHSRCHPLCFEKEKCSSKKGCEYVEEDNKCEDASTEIEVRGKEYNKWRFAPDCSGIYCTLGFWALCGDQITDYGLCYNYYNFDHKCCKRWVTTTTIRTTKPTATPTTHRPIYHIGDNCEIYCNDVGAVAKCPSSVNEYPPLQSVCSNIQFDHQCCKPTTTTTTPPPTTTTTTQAPAITTTLPTTIPKTDPEVDPEIQAFCEALEEPDECRKNSDKCAFSCSEELCVQKELIRDECSVGCYQHCFDPCGCKTALNGSCEYNTIMQKCLPREPECPEFILKPEMCNQESTFTAYQGMLCFNVKDHGNCKVQKNVLSVNLNGRRHTDNSNIDYLADDEIPYEDTYKGRKEYYCSHSDLDTDDQYLYEGLISAIGHGKDKRQCLRYNIPLDEDGMYMLTIKTYEPFAERYGRRMFNIELHDTVVVSNLDIFAVVGKDVPMTIVVNFKVTSDTMDGVSKKLTVRGRMEQRFVDSIKLGFCVGDCRLDDRFIWEIGNYVASAFSVTRVGDS